jgi:hypothetical protein
MGCEREREAEALSDYLLALRALLEPEGSPRGVLAGRLAALCAVPERRGELATRVSRALDLERAVIRGRAVENAAAVELVRGLGDHLRALLRDVICGHLDTDLGSLADELLLEPQTAEPVPAGVAAIAPEGPADGGDEHEEAVEGEPALARTPQRARAPIRMGREPMPVADELDEEQLRLIGTPG